MRRRHIGHLAEPRRHPRMQCFASAWFSRSVPGSRCCQLSTGRVVRKGAAPPGTSPGWARRRASTPRGAPAPGWLRPGPEAEHPPRTPRPAPSPEPLEAAPDPPGATQEPRPVGVQLQRARLQVQEGEEGGVAPPAPGPRRRLRGEVDPREEVAGNTRLIAARSHSRRAASGGVSSQPAHRSSPYGFGALGFYGFRGRPVGKSRPSAHPLSPLTAPVLGQGLEGRCSIRSELPAHVWFASVYFGLPLVYPGRVC
jgi:hypothetical protein